MATEPNRHDDAIDQVLAAMRHAAAPEGMDARILARLHQQQSASHAPVSPSVTSAWWRGAFTGAAAALVSVAALLLIQHDLRNPSTHPQTAQSNSGTHGTPNIPSTHAVIASVAGPCAPPTELHFASIATPPQMIETKQGAANLLAETRADTAAPSRPAPIMPLTAQERELVRLTHTADPKQLAEEEAKVDEESAAEFARLSAHSSLESSSKAHHDTSLDTTSKAAPETNIEVPSDATPEANQSALGSDLQFNPTSNDQTSNLPKEER